MAHLAGCSTGCLTNKQAITPIQRRFQPFQAARAGRSRAAHLQCRASIVSRSTLPEEFKEENGYSLLFVVFSRLAPEKTTDILCAHLSEHEAWLKGLGDTLAFHGPFLNAEASYYGSEMYAINAESAAEARQLVEQDPLHSKGVRKFELMSWVQKTSW